MSGKGSPRNRQSSEEDWAEEIGFAQLLKWYTFEDISHGRQHVLLERVPYTSRPGAPAINCHDCKVAPGQLHVPGCDDEVCPKCTTQACSCGCPRVETWHRLPLPDKNVAVVPPAGKHVATVDPIVSFANGGAQMVRLHIASDDANYVILARADSGERVYVPTPWINEAALSALKELPPLKARPEGET